MAAHPKIKLTYWPFAGRLAAPRLALTHANIPFELEVMKFDTWGEDQKDRKRFPTGDIPVMAVGDRLVCETAAIVHYTGLISGLWPSDPLEAATAVEIATTIEEIFTGCWGCNLYKTMTMFTPSLTPEEHIALRKGPFTEHLKFYLGRVNDIVAQNGHKGFSVGSKLSIIDFLVWHFSNGVSRGAFDHVSPEVLKPFEALHDVMKTVEGLKHDKVQELLAEFQKP